MAYSTDIYGANCLNSLQFAKKTKARNQHNSRKSIIEMPKYTFVLAASLQMNLSKHIQLGLTELVFTKLIDLSKLENTRKVGKGRREGRGGKGESYNDNTDNCQNSLDR